MVAGIYSINFWYIFRALRRPRRTELVNVLHVHGPVTSANSLCMTRSFAPDRGEIVGRMRPVEQTESGIGRRSCVGNVLTASRDSRQAQSERDYALFTSVAHRNQDS